MNREAALLYAQLNEYRKRKRAAVFLLRRILRKHTCYLACSFGKDSSVLLDMVLRIAPLTPVLFVRYEETSLIDNYDEVITSWYARYPDMNLHQIRVAVGIDDEYHELNAMKRFARSYDAAIVGIRAEESKWRRATIRKGLVRELAGGQVRVAPIGWWSTRDVAAYIHEHDIPLLDTYLDRGIEARTVSGVSDDRFAFRQNQLERLRSLHPDKYNKLIKLCPALKY